jgi:Fur family ferric uptake transcriptional regulator
MTHAPRSPRLPFDDIDDVARALREAGGRFSAPRRQVLETLFAADGPVTAEAVAGGLDGRTEPLEPASVYRALEYLESLGVVRHVHAGHGPGLYALTGQGEREYLACERCKRVTAVPSEQLDAVRAAIEREFGYRARFTHFPIVGLCATCAAGEAGS